MFLFHRLTNPVMVIQLTFPRLQAHTRQKQVDKPHIKIQRPSRKYKNLDVLLVSPGQYTNPYHLPRSAVRENKVEMLDHAILDSVAMSNLLILQMLAKSKV